jgi:adenylate kinase
MASLDKKIGEIGEWLGTGTLNSFGRQFAGKDEQSKRLGRHLGVEVLSSGQILRESTIPDRVRAIMDSGELIPTDDFVSIVVPYLGQTAFEGKPLLLSAVGRWQGEEAGVMAATRDAGHPLRAVPYLQITEEESFRRLALNPNRGRADDTPEALRNRLDEFAAKTQPVLDVYESMGLVVPIDAMPPSNVVFRTLVHTLHDFANS